MTPPAQGALRRVLAVVAAARARRPLRPRLLRTRIGALVTALCALAIAATAAAWLATANGVIIVATELTGLCTVAVVSTLAVRRALRPLEHAALAADAIAAGDLTRRITAADAAPSTEVGRLAHALNAMLDRIQSAMDAREASEERMRQFVADASHELRTPLQSLRGYTELYQHGALPDRQAVDEAVDRMHAEVRRMAKLVEALLLLARFDEATEARLEPVDLSRVVTDSARDAAAVEPTRPRTLRIEDGVTVLGDETQLRGLLANLLGNIRMHTPPATPCAVELSTGGGRAVLTVRDDGPGIPAHAVDRVFDRFYRADKGRSREHGGSGLGLAIAAAIAEQHHAGITLDSRPGEGTRVRVTFPHHRADHGPLS
ncbi:sensor histidine kinase [Streptomyces sp. NPDC091294]|uniref:sensor histidine kinase n=1 Tax=Streptomyces sp. NPDC091294 TaxID=3365992 RepID=UPI003811B95C